MDHLKLFLDGQYCRFLLVLLCEQLSLVSLNPLADVAAKQAKSINFLKSIFEQLVRIAIHLLWSLFFFRAARSFKVLELGVGDGIGLLNEVLSWKILVQWDRFFDRLCLAAFINFMVFEAKIGQIHLDRLMHVKSCRFAINQVSVELKVEQVEETASHVPAPMEKEAEEGVWGKQVA